MNPGVVDEVGSTTRSAIDALKSTPVLIALLLLQAITFGGVAWSVHQRASDMAEERRLFAEERKQFLELCVKNGTNLELLPNKSAGN
jgi:hypothetical protein